MSLNARPERWRLETFLLRCRYAALSTIHGPEVASDLTCSRLMLMSMSLLYSSRWMSFRDQDSFTLLCGVLLSAQTTDAQVGHIMCVLSIFLRKACTCGCFQSTDTADGGRNIIF